MIEAHNTSYTFHPGSTKTYQDLKCSYWWLGMKKDVVEYVSRCLTCQHVKAPRQWPAGLLQSLNIPAWKLEKISMDFISGLPKTRRDFNVIWAIEDKLTKAAHSIPDKATYRVDQCAQFHVKEIVRLHGVRCPLCLIGMLRLLLTLGTGYRRRWEHNSSSVLHSILRQIDKPKDLIKP